MAVLRGAGYDPRAATWLVPEHYNIAVDVADWHARDALAMIWCDYRGRTRHVRWGEMRDLSCRFANLYARRGTAKGDVVAVLMPQLPETAAAFLGAYRVGAILLTMSVLWSDEQVAARLESSGCRLVVTDAANTARLRDVVARRGIELVVLEDAAHLAEPSTFDSVATRADDPAQLYYTSGTSGPAKGILHAHRNLIGHNEFEHCHDLRPGELFYGAGEWAWSYAKLMGPWRIGAVHLAYAHERGFEPDGLLRAMSRHRVTNLFLNPTLLRIMRATAEEAALALPQWFRVVCCSNEPLPADLLDWFTDHFGVPIHEFYGMTESYPMIGYAPGQQIRPGSMGTVIPGWEVELRDEQDRPVAPGGAGEICLRARQNPQYPLEIWGDPQATASRLGHNWFRTGDTARVDVDGYWYFLGRNDDVIKTSGYRVGPYEIEEVLNAHPAVAASGVIGVPDEIRGQAVHAYVVVGNGHTAGDTLTYELQDWVRHRHSRFAYPRGITFVDTLPTSATGKVQRAALRHRYRRGHRV